MSNKPSGVTNLVIPIRIISQLFRTLAATWMATVRDLQNAERPMLAYYAPLIHALNSELKLKGTGRAVLQAETAGFGDNPTSDAVVKNSYEALDHFRMVWASNYSELIEALPEKASRYELVDFQGHLLKGGFHAIAREKSGERVLLYYHASDWKEPMLRAHAELLTVVAEQRHKMGRDSIRILDFRSGQILIPNWPEKRLRQDLLRHCELYEKVFG